jgi:hypothetical protein
MMSMNIYDRELMKGSYRLLFWLLVKYGNSGYLKARNNGNTWSVIAAKELGYSQPMMSNICKDLVRAGIFNKTMGGYRYEI